MTDNMNQKQQEKIQEKKNLEKFNSITQKVKPENQNQTHNVRKEAVDPKASYPDAITAGGNRRAERACYR